MARIPREVAEGMSEELFLLVSKLRESRTADDVVGAAKDAVNIMFGDSSDFSYIPTMFIAFNRTPAGDEMELIEPPVDDTTWDDFSKDEMIEIVREVVSYSRPDWVLNIFECYSVSADHKTAAAAMAWINMGQPLKSFPGAIEELRAHLTGGDSGAVNICLSRTINKDGSLGEVKHYEIDRASGRFTKATQPMQEQYDGAIDE